MLTGGGDCPGLNAVIRGIVKRASQEKDWEVIGCIESFNGVLREPTEIVELDEKSVHGLLVMGGTILGTTNKGGPFEWPVRQPDGSWTTVDRSDEMIRKLQYLGVDAVINIGGDGSQRISLGLAQKGLNIVGVPKTIDNDLSSTDYTFGFQTAVQIRTAKNLFCRSHGSFCNLPFQLGSTGRTGIQQAAPFFQRLLGGHDKITVIVRFHNDNSIFSNIGHPVQGSQNSSRKI